MLEIFASVIELSLHNQADILVMLSTWLNVYFLFVLKLRCTASIRFVTIVWET